MRILIKSVRVTDPASSWNGKEADILIENGITRKIAHANSLDEKSDKVFSFRNQHISAGWFDMRANFREPGFEYKEELSSGCRAAVRGGFTGVLLMPSTDPPVSGKAGVEFIIHKTAGSIVEVVPAGTLSQRLEGKDLSEMYDMWQSGARAFTDDKTTVSDAGLMLRALMYARNFGGLILTYANDDNLSPQGQVNEGVMNVNLGMKGIPSLAEEVMVARDISLAEYAGAPIHFSTVSTAGAVSLIREAKKKGLKVTADVAVHNLAMEESVLAGFDSHYKVMPPLRTKSDMDALAEGLEDGTIDCVCSDHTPEDIENKKKEFELAGFGIIGLESAFGVLNKSLGRKMALEKMIALITSRPRQILGLDVPVVAEGAVANYTLFDPAMEWTFSEADIASKSQNTPFIGQSMKGRALAVINKDQAAECRQS